MTEDETLLRATNAKRLTDDPTLKEAFAQIKQHYLGQIESSELSQIERRETAFKCMKLVDVIFHQLTSWVSEGKMIEDARRFRKRTPDYRRDDAA